MAWLRSLSPQYNKTLQYFDKYDYPLTYDELVLGRAQGSEAQRFKAVFTIYQNVKI